MQFNVYAKQFMLITTRCQSNSIENIYAKHFPNRPKENEKIKISSCLKKNQKKKIDKI